MGFHCITSNRCRFLYVLALHARGHFVSPCRILRQIGAAPEGLIVDLVGRGGRLITDFRTAMFTVAPARNLPLDGWNGSDGRNTNYEGYFDKKLAEQIAILHADDIRWFEYRF